MYNYDYSKEWIRRLPASLEAGGKSEQGRARWWLTATGRAWMFPDIQANPRESATEKIRPMDCDKRSQVKVKRCGKSAPHHW